MTNSSTPGHRSDRPYSAGHRIFHNFITDMPIAPHGTQDVPSDDVRLGGVYIISVAARLLEMHPQTLRKYERAGLVRPSRTVGMLRLYSDADLERLRIIRHLVDDLGLNLAGVSVVLELVAHIRAVITTLEAEGDGRPSPSGRAAAARLRRVLGSMGAG